MINILDEFVRIVGWILIGGVVGLVEGLIWCWCSIEVGDKGCFW